MPWPTRPGRVSPPSLVSCITVIFGLWNLPGLLLSVPNISLLVALGVGLWSLATFLSGWVRS